VLLSRDLKARGAASGSPNQRTYWVSTISRDHLRLSVEAGFTQAGHGKASGLKRLKADDWLVFYSPKTSLRDGELLQAFTAIGRVVDEDLYQVEMAPGFTPWRRNVEFVRVDSNYHGENSPQGPQPDPRAVDGPGSVRIVHFARIADASDGSSGATFVRVLSRAASP
jgi:hypothetical protein